MTLSPAKHEGLLEHREKFSAAVEAFVPRCPVPAQRCTIARTL